MPAADLRSWIDELRRAGELVEIEAEVDPYLEVTEIIDRTVKVPFERSTPEKIAAFSDIVFNAGYASPVRTPRGEDIMAACGQLKSASVKERRSTRDAAQRAAV